MRSCVAMCLIVALTACAGKHVSGSNQSAQNIEPDYLDLQAGRKLHVIIPILKSGGYRLHSLEKSDPGNLDHLSAGPDFLGYETDFYAVKRNGMGVHVEFRSAEVTQEGKTAKQNHPRIRLFDFPEAFCHIRLIYLVRVSAADHNMAIVAGETPSGVESMTEQVRRNSEQACKAQAHASCTWVPAGIAVRKDEK